MTLGFFLAAYPLLNNYKEAGQASKHSAYVQANIF